MSELAYKFNPAGHEMPEGKREHVKPSKELETAFLKWMRPTKKQFFTLQMEIDSAVNSVQNISATVEEAHALIIIHQDLPNISRAGMFLSAVYNNVPDKVIVYGLDIPLDHLASDLKSKIFINTGITGDSMGSGSTGILLNKGKTRFHMAGSYSGIVINQGEAGSNVGSYAKGILINIGKVEGGEIGNCAEGILINEGKTGEEFAKCFKGPVLNNGQMGFWESEFRELEHGNMAYMMMAPALQKYVEQIKQALQTPDIEQLIKNLQNGIGKPSV